MTFADIDSRETTATKMGNINTFGVSVLARINAFRAERKELKKLYSHHTQSDANQARAQRDANTVWY